MYEVFTQGGGSYLVDIFNAVAALSGGSAFANLIRVAAAFSLLWLMFQTAFGGSWMANVKWYAAFLAIYLALFTPRVDVHVTDRLNPAPPAATRARGAGRTACVSSNSCAPSSCPIPRAY